MLNLIFIIIFFNCIISQASSQLNELYGIICAKSSKKKKFAFYSVLHLMNKTSTE